MAELETTTLNRPWVLKTAVFMLGLLGFGIWGLVDATIIYPKRGIEDASFKQKLYLEANQKAGRLVTSSLRDPGAEHARLLENSVELRKAADEDTNLQKIESAGGPQGLEAANRRRALLPALADGAALRWLSSLALVSRVDARFTVMDDPEKTLAELKAKWDKTSPPKELAAYDLPLQWGFTFIGFAGFVYLVFLFVKTKATVYTWEPGTQTLGLPGGRTLSPAQIAEFDKRKWDKFYVFLHTKDGARPVKLDLYRHAKLEEWVLAMERTVFPERAAAEAGAVGAPSAV